MSPAGLRALCVVTLFAYALHAALGSTMAVDLWMAMACGRYIVEHHTLPGVDVFSYTYAGVPWFNGEWLAQVLLFALHRQGGSAALVLCKVAVVVACVLIAGWIGRRRSGSLALALVPAALAALIGRHYFDIRPDLFLYLGTLGVMAVVESHRRGGAPAVLALLPAMFAVWVNLHFSFIYGLGVLLLLATAEIAKTVLRLPDALRPTRRALWLGGAAVAAAVACLLNPHGVRALTFPFLILGEGSEWRTGITEWLPPVLFQEQSFNPMLFGYYFVLQCVLLAAALATDPRGVELGSALLVAVTAAMALSARRFVALFALVSAPFAAANLAIVSDWLAARGWRPSRERIVREGLPVILVVGAMAYVLAGLVSDARRYRSTGLFAGLVDIDYFPTGAVEFLDRNPFPSRLFHPYSWGGYVMYGAPAHKVFIDGRAHLVYPGTFLREHKAAEFGNSGWEEFLGRWQVSVVLWPSYRTAQGGYRKVLESLAGSPQWRRVYDDGHSGVFAHVERGRPWIEAYDTFALDYPDNRGALYFQADARFAAGQFDVARRLMREGLQRTPGRLAGPTAAEQRLEQGARSANDPRMWFQLAFYRDVRDDARGAAEAYAAALAHGLAEPHAAYARQALARLRGG